MGYPIKAQAFSIQTIRMESLPIQVVMEVILRGLLHLAVLAALISTIDSNLCVQ